MSRYIVSVDLGQLHDFTAIVVAKLTTRQDVWTWTVEHPDEPPMINLTLADDFVFDKAGNGSVRYPLRCARLDVVHIERFRQKSYPEINRHIQALMRRPPLAATERSGAAKLLVDMTGVGRPVLQQMRESRLNPIGITITAGRDESHHPANYQDWLVPKRLLIQSVDALLHRDALKIAPGLAEAENLQYELNDFRVRVDEETGRESFGARTGEHDDVVLALAQICWHVTQPERTSGWGTYVVSW